MRTEVKTATILAIGITVAIISLSVILSTFDSETDTPLTKEKNDGIDKSGFKKAPDLVGIAYYLNTTPEELSQKMKDKVVLYDIWTYSCINCVRTLPYITAWDEKYSDEGLLIIGIHSPEFEFEKDPKNVEMAIAKYGISYPVVMDNEMKTWKAFENRYWPRKYIADYEGYIRYDHIGEGAYKETEQVIQKLLEERAAALGTESIVNGSLVKIEEFNHAVFRTPELYFGYGFAQGRNQLGSNEGFSQNKIVTYAEPEKIELHKFYPIGQWKNLEDSMELIANEGTIKLRFNAKEVNVVTSNSAVIEIFLDGEPLSAKYAGNDITSGNKLNVKESGLYNIISSKDESSHLLEIKVNGSGFKIYTFTFG